MTFKSIFLIILCYPVLWLFCIYSLLSWKLLEDTIILLTSESQHAQWKHGIFKHALAFMTPRCWIETYGYPKQAQDLAAFQSNYLKTFFFFFYYIYLGWTSYVRRAEKEDSFCVSQDLDRKLMAYWSGGGDVNWKEFLKELFTEMG